MTDDELNRIDKQFDSLEEALRCGFARMNSRIDQFSAALEELRKRHAAIKDMRG
jgi:hypothetical protein